MASVGVIYAVRAALSRTAFEAYGLVGASVALWQLTWVHKVFENLAHVGFSGSGQFVLYAVEHTHLAVQLSLAVAVVAVVGLLWDVSHALARPQLRFA